MNLEEQLGLLGALQDLLKLRKSYSSSYLFFLIHGMHAVGLQRLLTPHILTVTLLRLSEPSLRVITVSPRTELQHSACVRHHSLHTPEGGQVHAGSLLSNRVRARAYRAHTTANRCVNLGIRFHSGICCCRASLALRRTRARVRAFVWLATPPPPSRAQNNELV